jgi:hypothetical protein
MQKLSRPQRAQKAQIEINIAVLLCSFAALKVEKLGYLAVGMDGHDRAFFQRLPTLRLFLGGARLLEDVSAMVLIHPKIVRRRMDTIFVGNAGITVNVIPAGCVQRVFADFSLHDLAYRKVIHWLVYSRGARFQPCPGSLLRSV